MINQFFPNIVCISLLKRRDRRLLFDKQAEGMQMNFKYFDAIAPTFGNQFITAGRLGCLRSHCEVIKLANRMNWDNVLILEDDCQFKNEYGKLFIEGMLSNPDYDLLYLGGTLWQAKVRPYNDYFNTGTGILTTHSYVVPKKSYDHLIDMFEVEDKPVDVKIIDFQESHKTLIFKHNITRQREGYSDIEKRNRLDNWIFDN